MVYNTNDVVLNNNIGYGIGWQLDLAQTIKTETIEEISYLKYTDGNGNDVNNIDHIANINPFRYRSYYYDKETNLYYLNSRYYSPTFGRFINADTEFGRDYEIMTYNLFVYSNNNPVSFIDLNGNFAIALPAALTVLKYVVGCAVAIGLTKVATLALKSVASDVISAVERKKVKVEEKVKEQVKSTVLPKDSVKKSNESNKQSKPCTRAWVYAGDVYRLYRLTIEESAIAVQENYKSVMCDTKADAEKVAILAAEKQNSHYYHDDVHFNKRGYYPHFHVYGVVEPGNHPHIWYISTP